MRRQKLLIVSLALNLFLLGAVTTGIVTHLAWPPPPPHPGGPAFLPSPRQLKAALPQEDQAPLKEVLEAHRGEIRPLVEALIGARRVAAQALLARPFDQAAFLQSLRDMRSQDQVLTDHAQSILAEIAGRVGQDGREAMAQLMNPPRPGPPPPDDR